MAPRREIRVLPLDAACDAQANEEHGQGERETRGAQAARGDPRGEGEKKRGEEARHEMRAASNLDVLDARERDVCRNDHEDENRRDPPARRRSGSETTTPDSWLSAAVAARNAATPASAART